mmetsp:Transcript_9183/g.30586  ORF Transcript_9183/g.30586 Transcript_9183/m.30586 type:complete len:269 (-) Transcript_9183:2-808(-)
MATGGETHKVPRPEDTAFVPGRSTNVYPDEARQKASSAAISFGRRTTTAPVAVFGSNTSAGGTTSTFRFLFRTGVAPSRTSSSSPTPNEIPSPKLVRVSIIGANAWSFLSFASLSSRAARRASSHTRRAPRITVCAALICPSPWPAAPLLPSNNSASCFRDMVRMASGVRYPAVYRTRARDAPIMGIDVSERISSRAPAAMRSCNLNTNPSTSPHPMGPHTLTICPACRAADSCVWVSTPGETPNAVAVSKTSRSQTTSCNCRAFRKR